MLAELVDSYVARSAANIASIGIEWERSGIYRDTGKPVRYAGTQGYLAVLQKLVDEVGWEVTMEEEGCGILELRRGITRITIEGDGRLELSGSPQTSLHDLARELRIHNNEVVEMGNVFNIGWLPLGLQPLHGNDEIELAPRRRYQIFQRFGDPSLMQTYSKRTNGLTVNVGYKDEQSAIRMAQTAFRIMPIVGAMFASSSLEEGKPSKYLDARRCVVHSHFPERMGIPRNILEPDFSLSSWTQYLTRLPLLLTKYGGITEPVLKAMTFEQWRQRGRDGVFPTFEDFDVHVKTTWSDLRLRPTYLEYRVADSVPFSLAMSLPAFIKGLFLDASNWDAIEAMTKNWTYDDIIAADKIAWQKGLKTKLKGTTLLSHAQDLLKLSTESLHALKVIDGAGRDESLFLNPLKEYIYIKETSPAEEILKRWETGWSRNYANLLTWCEET